MTAVRAAWIVCDEDGCPSQHPEDLSGETVGRVERQVREAGWRKMPGGRHRCPNHCPVCGATEPNQLCATVSGRDHAARRRQEVARV